jgi:hypothetical protein
MAGLFDPKTRRYATTPLSSFGTFAGGYRAAIKRKAFFSFHYDDIMRVNNVRNAWKITHPDIPTMRSFQDSSLWESKKLEGPEAIKRLIREGVEYTSAVCVLIGTETWQRRWVKYEIACSVIDGRGLLAVHINGLNHIERQRPDLLGFNPLRILGVGKASSGKFYLYENHQLLGGPDWRLYQDYTWEVSLPAYLREPPVGWVRPLSAGTAEYNYATGDGHKNIGAWIDHAAQRAGR